MPTSKSAEKRVRQNAARRLRNRAKKSAIHTCEKKFLAKVEEEDFDAARELLSQVSSLYDRAAKTNTIHRNRADRKKSRLAQHLAKAQQPATEEA